MDHQSLCQHKSAREASMSHQPLNSNIFHPWDCAICPPRVSSTHSDEKTVEWGAVISHHGESHYIGYWSEQMFASHLGITSSPQLQRQNYMVDCCLEVDQTNKIISNRTVVQHAWKGLATDACCLNGFAFVCSPQSQACCIKELPTCAAATIDLYTLSFLNVFHIKSFWVTTIHNHTTLVNTEYLWSCSNGQAKRITHIAKNDEGMNRF